jgi:hypothetical protein
MNKTVNRGNQLGYGLFLLAGAYYLLTGQYSNATIFLNLALVFDPFEIARPFGQRPLWQCCWLIAHLLLGLTAFVLLLLGR